jgi:hypothetical protein
LLGSRQTGPWQRCWRHRSNSLSSRYEDHGRVGQAEREENSQLLRAGQVCGRAAWWGLCKRRPISTSIAGFPKLALLVVGVCVNGAVPGASCRRW